MVYFSNIFAEHRRITSSLDIS